MQCLHCGKKLSLLRKLSDGRFCSEAHREEYERLEGDIALARLLGARRAREGAPPDKTARGGAAARGSILPVAPPLPEPLRAADWRRVASLPLELLEARAAQAVPESCLRPAVRGFPQALPTEFCLPAGRPCPAAAVPPPAPCFDTGQADTGFSTTPSSSRFSGDEPKRPPAMAGLAALPLYPAGVFRPPACLPQPAPAGRRKLVVIVPKPHRRLPLAGLAPAGPLRLAAEPAAARGSHPPRGGPAICPQCQAAAPALPRRRADQLPWTIQPAAAVALHCATAAKDPPLCSRPEPVGGFRPMAGRLRIVPAVAGSSFGMSSPLLPARPPHARLLQLRPAALCALETGSYSGVQAGPLRFSAVGWLQPEWLPAMPAAKLGILRRNGGWPAVEGQFRVEVRGASGELVPIQFPPEPLPVLTACAVLPARKTDLPPKSLRQLRALAPIQTAAATVAVAGPAAARPLPAWSTLGAALPGSRLELIPPDPVSDPQTAFDADTARSLPSLAALEAAVGAGAAAPAIPPAVKEPASRDDIVVPPPARRVPEMPVRPVAQARTSLTPALPSNAAACWASLDEPRPMIPRLRLELDHADGSGPRRKGEPYRKARRSRSSPGSAGARRFWSHAPSDLKWIAVVLPLLLVVVVYSFRAKTPNHPPEGGEMSATATAPAAPAPQEGRLNALQRMILRRAAVRLFDDFRGGLGSWEGREGWAKTWRYGDATFIEPGELALLTPSLPMTDYTLTFLGQIERRSLNWVFRAKDLANYYSMRIVITRGGPLPEAAVVRSVVINGREQEVRTLPIPFPVRADTLYLVRMEVRGQDFTTYIQNQVVDHFSDSRLKRGGVGFYSPKGDRALLRWVEVSHQYDYLGRLCALLSPYGVQNFASN